MPRLPLLLPLASLLLAAQQPEPAPPRLTIISDLAARLEIDGAPAGALQANVPLAISLTPGEHSVRATPEGGPAWSKDVVVSSALPNSLTLPLRSHVQRAAIEKTGYWHDDRTGLVWLSADNGSGVTVSQAHSWCRTRKTGGFSDWRLPQIQELHTLFGGPPDERGFRPAAPLKITGWSWSATTGNEPAENWALDLGDGARASVAAGDAGLNRALCVRSTGPDLAQM